MPPPPAALFWTLSALDFCIREATPSPWPLPTEERPAIILWRLSISSSKKLLSTLLPMSLNTRFSYIVIISSCNDTSSAVRVICDFKLSKSFIFGRIGSNSFLVTHTLRISLLKSLRLEIRVWASIAVPLAAIASSLLATSSGPT